MSECADFLELISAYADGELPEPDRRRVEEHLEACGQCSAILDFFREISVAANESCVPAPGELCGGVMEKVLGGRAAGNGAAGARPRLVRTALTRYLPLAACLAVMLISLPWVISNFRGQNFDNASAPEQAALSFTASSATEAPQGQAPEMGGGGPNPFGMELPAPASEALLPDDGTGAMARDMRGALDTGGGEAYSGEADGAKAVDTDAGGIEAQRVEAECAEDSGAEPGWDKMGVAVDMGDFPQDAPEFSDASLFDDFSAIGSAGEDADWPAPSEVLDALGGFRDAYAWIELTGERPNLLRGQEPKRLPAGSGFEEYYTIPRAAVKDLIEEASASDGIDLRVIPINMDGDNAVVLWKPH